MIVTVQPELSAVVSVVILTGRDDEIQSVRTACQAVGYCVMVTEDPYSAAVEILQASRAVLVVDVPTLRAEQAGLISLAARLGVPRFGLGQPGRNSPAISDLTLVNPAGLPQAIAEAIARQPAKPVPADGAGRYEPVPPADASQPRPVAEPLVKPITRQTLVRQVLPANPEPLKPLQAEPDELTDDEAEAFEAEQTQEDAAAAGQHAGPLSSLDELADAPWPDHEPQASAEPLGQSVRPDEVLTPEELEALLDPRTQE